MEARDYSNLHEVKTLYTMVELQGNEKVSEAFKQAVSNYMTWHQQQAEMDSTILSRTANAGWVVWNDCLARIDRYRTLMSNPSEEPAVMQALYEYMQFQGTVAVADQSQSVNTWHWDGTDQVGQENFLHNATWRIPQAVREYTERMEQMQAGIMMARQMVHGMEVELRRLTLVKAMFDAVQDEMTQFLDRHADNPVIEPYKDSADRAADRSWDMGETKKSEHLRKVCEELATPVPAEVVDTVTAPQVIAKAYQEKTVRKEEHAKWVAKNRVAYADRVIAIALEKAEKEAQKQKERAEKAAIRKALKTGKQAE